jgi:hypothetical protein
MPLLLPLPPLPLPLLLSLPLPLLPPPLLLPLPLPLLPPPLLLPLPPLLPDPASPLLSEFEHEAAPDATAAPETIESATEMSFLDMDIHLFVRTGKKEFDRRTTCSTCVSPGRDGQPRRRHPKIPESE